VNPRRRRHARNARAERCYRRDTAIFENRIEELRATLQHRFGPPDDGFVFCVYCNLAAEDPARVRVPCESQKHPDASAARVRMGKLRTDVFRLYQRKEGRPPRGKELPEVP